MAAGAPELSRFAIGFDRRDRVRLHELWDEVIDSEQWSEGEMTARFEAAWAAWNGAGAQGTVNRAQVQTSQVAPTVLAALGLNPNALKAVQLEGTPLLPGVKTGR